MEKRILTREEKVYIDKSWQTISKKAMARKIKGTFKQVKFYMDSQGYSVDKELMRVIKGNSMKGLTTFTKQEDNYIRQHYNNPDKSIKGIAKELNRSGAGVRGRMEVMGLVVDKKIISQRKHNALFKNGHKPVNLGKKQSDYMTPEAIERSKGTRFKKGNKPKNYKPIGSERLTRDGYLEVKVSDPNTWKLKHRILYEQEHGEIPKGNIITFKDCDPSNLSINNLESITKGEHCRRNSYNRTSKWDKEIAKRAIGNKLNKIKQLQNGTK